jgi:serine/threonine protein kinase HipA of HipAB toxin-antitoxin module
MTSVKVPSLFLGGNLYVSGIASSKTLRGFTGARPNVVARNQDDHVKNIAFLMDKAGAWSLSPAFDVTYAYNPTGLWTNRHQMTINHKTDDFTREDFKAVAQVAGLKRGRPDDILTEVIDTVTGWPRYANAAGVPGSHRDRIARTLRLKFDRRGIMVSQPWRPRRPRR